MAIARVAHLPTNHYTKLHVIRFYLCDRTPLYLTHTDFIVYSVWTGQYLHYFFTDTVSKLVSFFLAPKIYFPVSGNV